MTAPVAVPAPPPLVNIYDVELVHAGQWNISTGTWTATTEDLAYAVAALDCPAVRSPVIKVGHSDPRFDGEPAVGWIGAMRVDGGYTLVGDYMGLPGWLAATDSNGNSVLTSAYPDRSIEGRYDFRCQIGHLHPFVIEAVALLGVTPPGVGTLASLQDVAALYGVTASAVPPGGVPVAATIRAARVVKENPVPNPHPMMVAAGVTTEDVRRRYYDEAAWSHWITEVQLEPLQLIVVDDNSGKRYRVPVDVTGEDEFTFGEPVEVVVRYVDKDAEAVTAKATAPLVYASRAESRPTGPAKASGDPDTPPPTAEPAADADEPDPAPEPQPPDVPAAEPENPPNQEDTMPLSTEVRQRLGLADDADGDAVNAAIMAALAAQPPATAAPPNTPPDDADGDPNPEPKHTEPQPVAASLPPEAQAELTRMSQELAQIRAEKAATVKKNLFDSAVKAGKLRPADRADWETRYDKSPDVVTEIINAMADGTAVPVAAAGYTGDADTDGVDADFDAALARIDGPYATTGKGK